jgi:hypothetical protein
MFEGFFGRKGEKREYVNPKTGEAAAKPVVGSDGVVHLASSPAEELKVQVHADEMPAEFKEAA